MATYYWVGGSGIWDDSTKTNWATSSGGAGGNGPPTNADTINFDANSGTAATVTVAATAVSLNTTINKSDINLSLSGSPTLCTAAGTLTLTTGAITLGANTLTIGAINSNNTNTRSINFGTGQIILTGNARNIGAFQTVTGFSYSGTSKIVANYSGATGTRSISYGGAGGGAESNALNFYITAGTDAFTISGSGSYRTIDFTGFAGTLNNGGRTVYGNFIISSGMTLQAGTSITTFAATSGTQQITTNGVTIDFPLAFNATGATVAFQDALTQGSTRAFTITNGTVQLKAGVTSTVGVFATSGTNQKYLQSTSAGSQATLSQASGTVNANYLTIRDIAATGGATWNAFVESGNVNNGNNSGWDFFGPALDAEFSVALRSFTERRSF